MREMKDLFDFMLERVNSVGEQWGLDRPQAFARWFVELYFEQTSEINIPDGAGDGKIDAFFKTSDGDDLRHHVLNAKFTNSYGKLAPPEFYSELTRFWQAFANKSSRGSYLKSVRAPLRIRYQNLFEHYDKGRAALAFL